MLRLIKIFFYKEGWQSQSYIFSWLLQILRVFFHLLIFAFFLNFLETAFALTLTVGGKAELLLYVAVGVVFFQVLMPVITAPANALRHEQLLGTVELLFSSGHHPNLILLGLSLPRIISGILQAALLFIAFAVLSPQNLPAVAVLKMILSVLLILAGLMPLGWLLAAFVLLYHKSEIHNLLAGSILMVLSGTYFDTSRLPRPLNLIAECLPSKHALDLLRHCSGIPQATLTQEIVWQKWAYLIFFSLLTWTAAMALGKRSLHLAKRWGSLRSY